MKHSMIKYTLISTLTIGLTACGGGSSDGGSSAVTKFDGTWKSSACETVGSKSFKQTWDIDGNKLVNTVQVWLSSNNCTGTAKDVSVKANLDYKDETTVANTCAAKAQQVDVVYQSITASGITITGEQNIQNVLTSQGISNALPKYGLICKGTDGKLYRGLLTADKDASTAAKRPDEMDTTNPLIP